MNAMDFYFGDSLWEDEKEHLQPGGTVSAARFLTLMEGEDEAYVEDAFTFLEEQGILPDLNDLPTVPAGEAALRLRQEQQFVDGGMDIRSLKAEDPLRLYLEELASIPACGDPQILAMECAEGSDSARERLVNVSLHRVVKLAGEHTGKGVLLLDLIQEGSLGLWQGILAWTGHGELDAHLDWWIRFYMVKTVLLQARAGGVGQKMRQALEDYRAVDERLLSELGRNATGEEIAEKMHISIEEAELVKKMLDSARLLNCARIETEEKDEEPEDEQHVEDTALFQARQRILDLLSGLNEADAKLLTLRFGLEGGLPLSPEDTGKRLGLTPEEVVQREAAALAQLRGN